MAALTVGWISQNLINRTWLSGVSVFIEALNDPGPLCAPTFRLAAAGRSYDLLSLAAPR